MIAPWLPVTVVDMGGSVAILVLALMCIKESWRWSRREPDNIFRNYILLLTLAIGFFALSRSIGHLLKQLLIMGGQGETWRAIAPYSGAINSTTFIVVFAFGIYFRRSQIIQIEIDRYRHNLEGLIDERTAELARKNQDLIESRVALDNILNGSVPICITGAGHEVIQANRAYYQLWPPQPGLSKCHEQRPSAICDTDICPLRQIGNGKDEVVIETTKVIDGEERHFLVTARPHVNAEGKLLGIIESFQDITLWKQATDERALLERQLRQAQKMEAIGTMAGGIAHDFNNILTAIIGFAELGRIKAGGEDGKHFFTEILRAGERAKDLVRHILTFSNRSERTKNSVTLPPLVKEILQLVRASTPSTISIVEEIDPHVGHIFADPTQIHQVLMNLCTNGVQEMEKSGGTLTVSLQRREIDAGTASDSDLEPGSYAAIAIGDTGRGIPNSIKDKIFDPYFTTKPVHKGTGLGLAVAQGIIKNHGGAITFQSRVGKGTTFLILLPLLEARPLPENNAGETTDLPTGNEHILVVDDEPTITEVLTDLLQSLGYRVTATNDSRQALETYRSNPEVFDLIITDQTMPRMTGLELARAVSAIDPEMPLILCTGFSRDVDAETAKRMGIKGFAMKPLSFGEIARLVRSLLD